jgi:hypothetical protein
MRRRSPTRYKRTENADPALATIVTHDKVPLLAGILLLLVHPCCEIAIRYPGSSVRRDQRHPSLYHGGPLLADQRCASAKAAGEDSPAARALGFTMAMLQRRFASSAYAARRK